MLKNGCALRLRHTENRFMPDQSKSLLPPGGQFLVYQTEDGKLKLDVRFEGETVWLWVSPLQPFI